MSLFKPQQVYGCTFWRWVRGHIFRTRCDSYLLCPEMNALGKGSMKGHQYVCQDRMGHRSRHYTTDLQCTWGIGDNLV